MCSRDSLEHIIDTEKMIELDFINSNLANCPTSDFILPRSQEVCAPGFLWCMFIGNDGIDNIWVLTSCDVDILSISLVKTDSQSSPPVVVCEFVKFFFLPLCYPNLWRCFGFLTCALFGYICLFGLTPGFWPRSASISHNPPVSAFTKYHWTEPALLSMSASGSHPFLVFLLL